MAQRTGTADAPSCYVFTQLVAAIVEMKLIKADNVQIYKHLSPFERWLLECHSRSAATTIAVRPIVELNGLEDGSNDQQQRKTI